MQPCPTCPNPSACKMKGKCAKKGAQQPQQPQPQPKKPRRGM